VFAAVMITVERDRRALPAARRAARRVASFNAEGTATALATVLTLAVALPRAPVVHRRAAGPEFSAAQLAFAAVASLALYGLFVLDPDRAPPRLLPARRDAASEHATSTPTRRPTARPWSLGLLLVALVAVVGLAKLESRAIEDGVSRSAPAVGGRRRHRAARAAARDAAPPCARAGATGSRRALNLALGSAMASIGLTIPAIAVASIWLDGPLELGLGATQIVLLAITAASARSRCCRAGRRSSRAACTSCSSARSCSWRSTREREPASARRPAVAPVSGGRGRAAGRTPLASRAR
jgi:Ca2+:H+ antiporter